MKEFLLAITIVSTFTGCSAKEINANTDSITSDITNAFESSKDKSN